jgi:AP-3 complex subunit sigma
VFVESLDKCFKNVCELDLIFNYDKLDLLLNQIILGGIVLDTSVESIISNFQSQLKILKQSSSVSSFSTSL